MIETEQRVAIGTSIGDVWAYAHDIKRWANLMPGLQECTLIDGDNSRWTLKVGAGGLVRTVRVSVHVERWAGPEHVTFAYKLEGDPVAGGGTYNAVRKGERETEITLKVHVEGGGPMAPMWEAMGRTLLPSLARGFAERLKAEIESSASGAPEQRRPAPMLTRIINALRGFWRRLLKLNGNET